MGYTELRALLLDQRFGGRLSALALDILDEPIEVLDPIEADPTWVQGMNHVGLVMLACDMVFSMRIPVRDGAYNRLCSRVVEELAKLDLSRLAEAFSNLREYSVTNRMYMTKCTGCGNDIPAFLLSECPYCNPTHSAWSSESPASQV